MTPNQRGDHLFVKPLQAGVTTNLTVVTGARTYTFELEPLSGPLPNMAYTVRFTYPAAASAVAPAPRRRPNRGPLPAERRQALRPSRISDDGVHTYIEWPREAPLPAIYAIDEQGQEILVNGGDARRPVRDRRMSKPNSSSASTRTMRPRCA